MRTGFGLGKTNSPVSRSRNSRATTGAGGLSFGKGEESRTLGIGQRSLRSMWFMLALLIGLGVAIWLNLPGVFLKTREKLDEGREEARESLRATPNERQSRSGDMPLVVDDPTSPDAEDMELAPTLEFGDTPTPGETEPEPDAAPTPEPESEVVYQEVNPERIARIEAALPARPAAIPAHLSDHLPVRADDTRDDARHRFGELHAWMLTTVNGMSDADLAAHAHYEPDPMWEPNQTVPYLGNLPLYIPWYRVRPDSADANAYVGRIFTGEATVFDLRRVPASDYNLEEGIGGAVIIDGQPLTEVWEAILSIPYNSYEATFSGTNDYVRKYATVYMTMPRLPEGIDPANLYGEDNRPPRVRFHAMFFRLRQFDSDPVPHLVAGKVEQIDSPRITVEQDLLERVDDSTNEAMRQFPLAAIHNMLATFRDMTPEERQALRDSVDPDIGWMDLVTEPANYRKLPTPVRFTGQIRLLGDERRAFTHFDDIAPNPYGIRDSYFGVVVTLDEYDRQQVIAVDTLDLWLTCPHCNEFAYHPRDPGAPPFPCENCGATLTRRTFEEFNQVEVVGYFLWKWQYNDQEQKWQTVPRIVAESVRLLPPIHDPVGGLKWWVVGVVGVMFIGIFFLLRREHRVERTFRKDFLKRQVEKLDRSTLQRRKTKKPALPPREHAEPTPNSPMVEGDTEDASSRENG